MYVVTKAVWQLSNVVGDTWISTHPVKIKLQDGTLVACDFDSRENALIEMSDILYNQNKKGNGYAVLSQSPLVRFKVLSVWDNDSSTSGSKIRWEIPKDAELIY